MTSRLLLGCLLLSACGPTFPVSFAGSEDAEWYRAFTPVDVGYLEIDALSSSPLGITSAGFFAGQVDFDGTTLTGVNDAAGNPTKDVFLVRHQLDGTVRWVRHFGGSGAEGNVYDSVDDDEGTTYASGAFGDSLQLDAFRLDADVSVAGAEVKDARGMGFLFAVNADGGVRWAEALRGDVPSGGNEIALAPDRDLVQVGIFGGETSGSITVAGTTLPFEGGKFDTFVRKLSPAGQTRWVRHIGGTGAQRGKAVTATSDGAVLVGGDAAIGVTRFEATRSFSVEGNDTSTQDFWIAKYDAAGTLLFAHQFGGPGYDELKGLVEDAQGNIVFGAVFTKSITLAGTEVKSAYSGKTALLAALSPTGDRLLWARTASHASFCCEVERVGSEVFFAGQFIPPIVTLDDRAQLMLEGIGQVGLTLKLGDDGTLRWAGSLRAGSSESGELSPVGTDFVALAMSATGDVKFGTEPTKSFKAKLAPQLVVKQRHR